jgi:ribosomal protein L7/L12
MEPLEEKVAQLEQQMAFLYRYLGIDPAILEAGGALPPNFYAALQKGKTVEAIKIYRDATGASLVTAKNAVEAIARTASRS